MTHSYEVHLKVRQRHDPSTHMHIHAMHTHAHTCNVHSACRLDFAYQKNIKKNIYIYIHRSARIECIRCAMYTLYSFVRIPRLECIQMYTLVQCIQGAHSVPSRYTVYTVQCVQYQKNIKKKYIYIYTPQCPCRVYTLRSVHSVFTVLCNVYSVYFCMYTLPS